MKRYLTVAVSRGPSRNPAKQKLENDLLAALASDPGIHVLEIAHLNDISPKGKSVRAVRAVDGDLVVLSWLYDRAAHWLLDRMGIEGQSGGTDAGTTREIEGQGAESQVHAAKRVIETRRLPDRTIYCIDLKNAESAESLTHEVQRIAATIGDANRPASSRKTPLAASSEVIDEPVKRRWYPVIDYSRCTNCMECIDFCLFGVYGIDEAETILVEQPDTCRKGCPACSRVCPESAIMFPQHATPAIAGGPAGEGSLKVDLSVLFGAPDAGQSALERAQDERDEQLQQSREQSPEKDELDKLIDTLDELDL